MTDIAERAADDTVAAPASQIQLRNLTMRYGQTVAVDDLDLDIHCGEMLVLLGPSGCGKTSTMRSIVGLETPSTGSIRVGDQTVFDASSGLNVPPNKRGIGMVFQSYAIWPHKNVFQNVSFPLQMQRVARREMKERVEDTLERVGLAGMGPRSATRLSGGQMQRVALARSLVMRPQVLLLDEPLSNLDAKLRDRLRFELKELQQEIGVTSVYVTHDQSEAMALADRVAVMRSGVIQQLDAPRVCYEEPRSRFVADFLGVTNLFPGEEVSVDDGVAQVRLDGADLVVRALDRDLPTKRVSVCIRPDGIRLARAGGAVPAGEPAENSWPGVVQTASFLGTHVRYRVHLDCGLVLDVVAFARHQPLAEGDAVQAQVSAEDIRLVTDEDDAS